MCYYYRISGYIFPCGGEFLTFEPSITVVAYNNKQAGTHTRSIILAEKLPIEK